ncbi:hypothetical protein FQR65_LT16600 [Abscondita terminalis]|nr:hypothetical protein FQR65_LT16600 [Abscondita terminalis]
MSENMKGRVPNFSASEKLRLLRMIADKYASIIEDKKTDRASAEKKLKAWYQITNEFNATSVTSVFRSLASLKKCYENRKKELRKTVADERKETTLTGGGPPPKIKKDETDDILISIINEKTLVGIKNPFDDDAEESVIAYTADEPSTYEAEFYLVDEGDDCLENNVTNISSSETFQDMNEPEPPFSGDIGVEEINYLINVGNIPNIRAMQDENVPIGNEIDEEVFKTLTEKDVAELIPTLGLRKKFWAEFHTNKSDILNACDEPIIFLDSDVVPRSPSSTLTYTPSSSSLSGLESSEAILDDLTPGVLYSKKATIGVPYVISSYSNSVRTLLDETEEGKIIKASYSANIKFQRSKLCELIIKTELQKSANKKIYTARFIELAREINDVFFHEDQELYYVPYVNDKKGKPKAARVQPAGYLLLEIDFKNLFEGKDNIFLTKWPIIYKYILAIAAEKKDNYLNSIQAKYESTESNDTTDQIYALTILPLLFNPVLKCKGSGKHWKPLKSFALEPFLLLSGIAVLCVVLYDVRPTSYFKNMRANCKLTQMHQRCTCLNLALCLVLALVALLLHVHLVLTIANFLDM